MGDSVFHPSFRIAHQARWSFGSAVILRSLTVAIFALLIVGAPAVANFQYQGEWGTEGTGPSQFQFASGLTVDSHDNVYVVDGGNGRVSVFRPDGTPVVQCGSPGSGTGQLNIPFDVAVDGAGYIYVSALGGHNVTKFAPITSDVPCGYVTSWAFSPDNRPGKPAYGIAVAPGDTAVYVAGGSAPDNQRVIKFTTSGTPITAWGGAGSAAGQFTGYMHLAVDSLGRVYVADYTNGRVQRFSSAGTFISQFGSNGSGDGQFYGPHGLGIDAAGGLWVAETGVNYRFQQFTLDGGFAAKYGSYGTAPGQFTIAYDAAADSNCNVYVLDTSGVFAGVERVQKFGQTEAPYCRAPVGSSSVVRDVRPPILNVIAPRVRGIFGHGFFPVSVRCPMEDCVISGTATISLVNGAARSFRVTAKPRQGVANKWTRIFFKINRRALRAIHRTVRSGGGARFTVHVKAVDGAGNKSVKLAKAGL